MKKLFLTLAIIALASWAHADTIVVQSNERAGGLYVVTLTVTADGDAGAVEAHEIDLSNPASRVAATPWYFYMLETIPDRDNAPNAYTLVLKDEDGGTVLDLTARATDAKQWADAAEDLPNYWPVTGNLFLDLSDIGANGETVIKLILTR